MEPSDRKIVRARADGSGYFIFCPACKCGHLFDARWPFNGNMEKPTFGGSMMVRGVKNAESDPTPTCCHSFVADGQIRFLADCTHALAGKTVPLEPF